MAKLLHFSAFVFRKNMGVVVQPNVYDLETGARLQPGNLVLITENGGEVLQHYLMQFGICE
jgi:hypothetical protein